MPAAEKDAPDLLPCCRGEGECQAPPDIGPCAENDVPAYVDLPSPNPLICRRCGALVDRAFLTEHDSHHTRIIPPAETEEGGE